MKTPNKDFALYDTLVIPPSQEYEVLDSTPVEDFEYDAITSVKDFFLKFMRAEDIPVSHYPVSYDEENIDMDSIPENDYDMLDAYQDYVQVEESKKSATTTKVKNDDDA